MKIFNKEYTAKKGFTAGTHRERSPEQTFEAYRQFLPKMGITRLANVTGLDCIGLPVYVAIRPNSRGLSTSQGKGLDPFAAKVSAMMESIETWHAERLSGSMVYESYTALKESSRVVDVAQLPMRKGAQFQLDAPILWVEGFDLLTSEKTWVPWETVSTNFVQQPGQISTFFMSSNGLASGNHLLEAISHALCEVIERDALTLFYQSPPDQSKARQIKIETIDDPSCLAVLEKLEKAGVCSAVWDITSDIGIPAFAAAIFEPLENPNWRSMGMFSGYGCHTSPGIALLRALNEAVQSRLTMITGSRDDLFPRDYTHCSNLDDLRAMTQRVQDPPPVRDFRACSSLSSDAFETDLEAILKALQRVGIEQAVVVNLTQAEIGIPVVKVVVPGLEGIFLTKQYHPGKRALAQLQQGVSS